jgi:hypothetical protein
MGFNHNRLKEAGRVFSFVAPGIDLVFRVNGKPIWISSLRRRILIEPTESQESVSVLSDHEGVVEGLTIFG